MPPGDHCFQGSWDDGERMRLSYSNVMATIAVFIALGGTGVAAVSLSRNSVGSKQIRRGAVKTSELH